MASLPGSEEDHWRFQRVLSSSRDDGAQGYETKTLGKNFNHYRCHAWRRIGNVPVETTDERTSVTEQRRHWGMWDISPTLHHWQLNLIRENWFDKCANYFANDIYSEAAASKVGKVRKRDTFYFSVNSAPNLFRALQQSGALSRLPHPLKYFRANWNIILKNFGRRILFSLLQTQSNEIVFNFVFRCPFYGCYNSFTVF